MSSEQSRLEVSISLGSASFSASGATEDVLGLYEDFKDLAKAKTSTTASKSKTDLSRRAADGDSRSAVKTSTSLPLKPYVARLNLSGNKEKATAIIAWSAESGHEPALNIGDLKKLWKKTPFKMPANVARDLGKAEVEGWLEREGKAGSPEAKYSITGYGEDAVANWIGSSD